MTEAGGLDQQAIRPGLAQQTAEADLEGCATHAAQAAARDLGQADAVLVTG
jgi:hypothetical protein